MPEEEDVKVIHWAVKSAQYQIIYADKLATMKFPNEPYRLAIMRKEVDKMEFSKEEGKATYSTKLIAEIIVPPTIMEGFYRIIAKDFEKMEKEKKKDKEEKEDAQ